MRLILMRHGDAVPGHGLPDHDRPLTPRGRLEAASVARQLSAAGWTPAAIRSSDALRTRQTWEAASAELPDVTSVSWTRALYNPTLERLIADARSWSSAHPVLCLGHNPGWSDAASRLSGVRVGMGTAYAALLEGEGDDWEAAFARRWTLVDLLRPGA